MVVLHDTIKSDFLTNPDRHLYIDGGWTPAQTEDRIPVINPANGTQIATLASGGVADIDVAVDSARRAFEGRWRSWSPYERQSLFMRIHDVMDKNFDELAYLETIDMGAPLSRTKNFKKFLLQSILFYSGQVSNTIGQTLPNSLAGSFTTFTLKDPVGVVGGIIPWNGPLISQWWVLLPALAAGCTIVMKPAEDASLTVLRVAELLSEAGVPDGVVNVVTGYGKSAGSALAAHPGVDRIAFTGSTETGREIIRASAGNMKRLQLELGGKSPDIVFADADLDKAVPGAAMAVFTNSGQVCYAGTRLFVQREIHAEFVERLTKFSRSLKMGNGLDSEVQLGPLISNTQLERVMGYLAAGQQEGANLACGGRRMTGDLSNGFFVEPTIFSNVSNQMTIAREEIFGPVISVIPFDTAEEVLVLANDTEYGLGGAVWTSNVSTAMQMAKGINAGTIWINSYGVIDPAVGFGGHKHSGYGWKGGPQHIDAFLVQKAVYLNEI